MQRKELRPMAALCLGLGLLACKPTPSTLNLSTSEVTLLEPGASTQVAVTVLDTRGKVMEGVPVTWKSSDETIARVAGGTISAVGSGEAVITATLENQSRQVKARVSIADHIDVGRPQIDLTDELPTVKLEARILTETGAPWEGKYEPRWSVQDASVAAVERGVITGLKVGTTLVTVEAPPLKRELAVNSAVTKQQAALASHAVAVSALPPTPEPSILPELPAETKSE